MGLPFLGDYAIFVIGPAVGASAGMRRRPRVKRALRRTTCQVVGAPSGQCQSQRACRPSERCRQSRRGIRSRSGRLRTSCIFAFLRDQIQSGSSLIGTHLSKCDIRTLSSARHWCKLVPPGRALIHHSFSIEPENKAGPSLGYLVSASSG